MFSIVILILLGLLTLSLLAQALIVRRLWQLRRSYDLLVTKNAAAAAKRSKASQQAEARRDHCLSEMVTLLRYLTTLISVLCNTDEFREAEMREQYGHSYQHPVPVEGCLEIHIEAIALQKTVQQCIHDLDQRRASDLDTQFYWEWYHTLNKRYILWGERREAIAELERLQGMVEELLQKLDVDAVCEMDNEVDPMELVRITDHLWVDSLWKHPLKDSQSLCKAVKHLQKRLEQRKNLLVQGDENLHTIVYCEWLDALSENYRQLYPSDDPFIL